MRSVTYCVSVSNSGTNGYVEPCVGNRNEQPEEWGRNNVHAFSTADV